MKKDDVLKITRGWSSKLLKKYNKQFKEFFINLKNQFQHNDEAREILAHYAKTGTLTKEESKKLKDISYDILKMVGLGSLIILPIPGGTLLMLFLVNSAKKLGIDLLPTKFKKEDDLNNDNNNK